MSREICGECKWHFKSDWLCVLGREEDWYCAYPDSPHCQEFTDYTDTCEEFEQRGIE